MRISGLGCVVLMLTAGIWPGRGEAATHVVTISQMSFGELPHGVRVGDTIEWRNADPVPHTVTAPDAGFDVPLEPDARAAVTLERAGTFEVLCTYHPGMRAELVIE